MAGLVQFQTNTQIDEAERKKAEGRKPTDPVLTGLAGHIRTRWEQSKRAKISIEQVFLKAKRQRNGEYEPMKLAAIKAVFGAEYTPVYMLLTETKCRAAEAWIKDVLLKSDADPWDIKPTPLPDLPKEFEQFLVGLIFRQVLMMKLQEVNEMQQAGTPIDAETVIRDVKERLPEVKERLAKVIRQKAKAGIEKMREKLADLFAEGEWKKALDDLIFDLVTYGVAFMKGPIVTQGIVRKRKLDPVTVKWASEPEQKLIAKWMRRSPFDIYPAPDAVGINDGYVIDKISLTPWELSSYIGVSGFDDNAIYACLEEYRNGGLKEWTAIDSEKAHLERRDSLSIYESEKIDCLHYMGSAQGQHLIDWGLSREEIPNPLLEYKIDAFLIGRHVITAMINPDPEGKKRLYKACFSDDPDSFWGRGGIPALIEDIQNVCNAIARAIVNNVAIASGPQVEVDSDRASGNVMQLTPWKVWRSTSKQMQEGQAIKFYMPSLVVAQLQGCYEFFLKLADEDSGIPRYSHGETEVGGAGKALADYEKILTPHGLVEICNLKVGDEVVNSYGSFSKVTGVYPQSERDIFRVKFSNGEHIDCDICHRWLVRTHHDRKFRILETKQIFAKGLFRKTVNAYRNPTGYRPKWMLPLIDYVEFNERKVKIDPYTMGVLLGDGDHRGRVTSMDKEIFNRIPYQKGNPDYSSDRGTAWTQTIKGIRPHYRSYGLHCKSIDKFIPEDYLFNSKEVRLELLRGLMDTDGCCSREGWVFFSTSSYKLAEDFRRLVQSLGATVNGICEEEGSTFEIRGRKCNRQKNYRIHFYLPDEKIFHLQRKQKRVSKRSKTHVYITGIEYIGRNSATCISVNSKDRLFICGNYIPTHNTASGLSMLMTQSARGVKMFIKNIDEGIIEPSVTAGFFFILDTEELGFDLIGDCKVIAKGSSSLIAKEQQAIRRTEFLNTTNNPLDSQIIGIKGRKYLLEETAKSLEIDLDKLFEEYEFEKDSFKNLMGGLENALNKRPGITGAETTNFAGDRVAGQDFALAQQGKV